MIRKNIKNDWGRTIIAGLGIIFLYFALRLVNLTILPIFADEAIYIRWSQVMWHEPTLRFLPLSDGKQPLFMWLTIPFLKIFTDPLFAGRFLSVLAGLGSLIGIFLLTLQLFSGMGGSTSGGKDKKTALLASFIYAIIPFTVFFDRMALVDSMLAMFGIWVIYFAVLLVKTPRLDLAMITGMMLGAALITKSPAIFFVILLPTTALFIKKGLALSARVSQRRPASGMGGSALGGQLIKLMGFWVVVYVFAFGIYNLLRLGPNFKMIAIRNKDYVFPIKEILFHPLNPLKPHLGDLIQWLPNLLTWPVFLLAIGGLIWLWVERKKWERATFLFLLTAVPLLTQSVFAKVFTPRYILFTIWPLLILAAYFLQEIKERLKLRKGLFALFLLAIAIPAVWYDYLLLANPDKAPLPRRMRSGYLEEWTAGTGIKEASLYLRERAKERKILVGTEGYFGTLPDGLQIYLERVPNITTIGIGLYPDKVPQSLIDGLIENEVYLLINNERLALEPEKHNLILIRRFPKAERPDGTQQSLLFFMVK